VINATEQRTTAC